MNAFTINEKDKVSDELNDLFIRFLEDVHPKRLSDNLRKILLRYLIYEHEALPLFFGDLLLDLDMLFNLLDTAEKESKINDQI